MAGIDLARARTRAGAAFSGFTSGQKAMMVAAAAVVAVGLLLLTRSQGGPSMAALYTGLDATDASAITADLSSKGVAYELSANGSTVLVPSDQVASLRLDMAAQGLPAGSKGSWSLIDKQGITVSEFRQRVDYQRALAGELGRTIEAMNGVQSAIVNLVIPPQDTFALDTTASSASVLVKSTDVLTEGQVRSIVNLVSTAVPDLTTDKITVTDAQGNQLWYPGKTEDGGGAGDLQASRQRAFQNQLAADLEQLIVPITGPGKVRVQVSADLDFDQREQTTTRFQNPAEAGTTGLVTARSTKTETYAGGGNSAGPLGANGQPTTGTSVAGNGYTNAEDTSQFAVDQVNEVVKTAPGAVRRLNVAVLVDGAKVNDAALQQITQLVTSGAGLDTQTRGDTVSVQRMNFDQTSADAAAQQLGSAKNASAPLGLLRTILVAVVILVALFLAWRSVKKASKPVISETIDLRELTMVRDELRELTGGTPMLDSDGREVSAGSTAALPAGESAVPAGLGFQLEPIPLPASATATQQMEAEIAEMIERQPEDVALLLRGWLAERRAVRR